MYGQTFGFKRCIYCQATFPVNQNHECPVLIKKEEEQKIIDKTLKDIEKFRKSKEAKFFEYLCQIGKL